jgi:hypothetical protein
MNRERLVRIVQLKKEKGNKKRKTRLKATTSIAFSMEKLRKFLIVWLSLQEFSVAEVNTLTQEE